jgi:hypothetical protein
VTLDDQDEQSRSIDSTHYMKYVLTISRQPNGGTSNLTNGRATLTLTDVLGTQAPASNAVFQEDASDGRCSAGSGSSSHIVTCSVPNFAAGAEALVYQPLIFTTTSRPNFVTRALASVTFKEKGSDSQPNDPNIDTVNVTNDTLYEPFADVDSSWSFPKAALSLGTSTADDQHTKFFYKVPDGGPSFTGLVQETAVGSVLVNNPCGTNTCYGEIADTSTNNNSASLFSSSTPAHVVITWNFLPSGKTKNNIVVYHRLDSGSNEPPITSSCTFASGIPTNLPCRDVDIQRGGGQVTVTIDVWSAGNGRWGVG